MIKAFGTRALSLMLAMLLASVPLLVQAQPDPGELVRQTFEESVRALKGHEKQVRNNPRVAYQLIEEKLAPHVDFELMSRLILARHWMEATPEQRKRFVKVFRESLLRTYSKVLSDNVDEAVRQIESDRELLKVLPVGEPDSRGRVTVRTRVRFQGETIPMDYRMYLKDGEWKAFDVLIEDISFVMNYRSEYNAELQRGNLDELIRRLAERNKAAWQEK